MAKVYTVPKITAGQATPAKFNAPLEYIQKSLNTLEAKLDGLAISVGESSLPHRQLRKVALMV